MIPTHINLKCDGDLWVFPDQRVPPELTEDATQLFN